MLPNIGYTFNFNYNYLANIIATYHFFTLISISTRYQLSVIYFKQPAFNAVVL